jgi:DNA-binding IclR family transcriptional regulator
MRCYCASCDDGINHTTERPPVSGNSLGSGKTREIARASRGPAQPVQAVDRAMTLLRTVATSPEPPSINELANAAGLNRSTAWRLLATLEKHALVELNPASNRYTIGYAAMQIGAVADHGSLVRRVRPALTELLEMTGERVSLAIVKGVTLIYVDQLDPTDGPQERWVGAPLALHASSAGKILLAYLPPSERAGALPSKLVRYTPTTITDPERLEIELATARKHGYATCAGEDVRYSNGVSAAVLDPQDHPIAVINVWGIEQRVPKQRFAALGGAVKQTADDVAALLHANS